jgi:hypothetical protein
MRSGYAVFGRAAEGAQTSCLLNNTSIPVRGSVKSFV